MYKDLKKVVEIVDLLIEDVEENEWCESISDEEMLRRLKKIRRLLKGE